MTSRDHVIQKFSNGDLAFGYVWNSLQNSLRDLPAQRQNMEQTVLQSDEKVARIDDEIQQVSATIAELTEKLKTLKTQKTKTISSVEDIKNKLSSLDSYMERDYTSDQQNVDILASVETEFMKRRVGHEN